MFTKQTAKPSNNSPTLDVKSCVDANTTIEGDFTFQDGLEFNGNMKGNLRGVGENCLLVVGRDAVIQGSVSCQNIVVDGRIEGPVKAFRNIVVRQTGNISGDISYGKIQLDEGSRVDGKIVMLSEKEQKESLDVGGVKHKTMTASSEIK